MGEWPLIVFAMISKVCERIAGVFRPRGKSK